MPSPKDTKGPRVKTGPTKGENRSRKNDGSWRKKRSDAGKKRSKSSSGGCFITTAACAYRGLPDDCFELTTLRDFRDEYLFKIEGGKNLVDEYYAIAPDIVSDISDSELEYCWSVITESVACIVRQDYSGAELRYREMVTSLLNLRK